LQGRRAIADEPAQDGAEVSRHVRGAAADGAHLLRGHERAGEGQRAAEADPHALPGPSRAAEGGPAAGSDQLQAGNRMTKGPESRAFSFHDWAAAAIAAR